jgi:hypothetical protein
MVSKESAASDDRAIKATTTADMTAEVAFIRVDSVMKCSILHAAPAARTGPNRIVVQQHCRSSVQSILVMCNDACLQLAAAQDCCAVIGCDCVTVDHLMLIYSLPSENQKKCRA